MAYIELSHFTALYPERVLKLVFLDAAYDNASSETKAVFEKNPLPKMVPAWPEDEHPGQLYLPEQKAVIQKRGVGVGWWGGCHRRIEIRRLKAGREHPKPSAEMRNALKRVGE